MSKKPCFPDLLTSYCTSLASPSWQVKNHFTCNKQINRLSGILSLVVSDRVNNLDTIPRDSRAFEVDARTTRRSNTRLTGPAAAVASPGKVFSPIVLFHPISSPCTAPARGSECKAAVDDHARFVAFKGALRITPREQLARPRARFHSRTCAT